MYMEVDRVTKRFGGLVAIDDVSFSLEKGQITALIGPNGAGKTTMFNCLSGFYSYDKGVVRLHGESLKGLMPHQILRKGVARTFQLVRNFQGMTILENIMTAGHCRSGQHFVNTMFFLPSVRRSEYKLRSEALEILDFLQIADIADKHPNDISYGQKRLVEVAKVLATGADLLLLDEPAAGLNDQETASLMRMLRNIQSSGKTILIVEHNMKFVMGLAQKIVVLDFGQKIADGAPEEVRTNPKVISAYLGREFSNA